MKISNIMDIKKNVPFEQEQNRQQDKITKTGHGSTKAG